MRPVFATPALLLAAVLATPAHAGELRNYDDAALHAVQFVDDSEGWAVGDDGVIWHSIDAGKVWERIPSNVRASLRSVCFVNPYFGWIAGREELPDGATSGVLLCTQDGGVHWRRVLVNALPGLNAVRFADDKTGYLLGDGSDHYPSGVFTTTDAGRSWQPMPGPRIASWLAADFSGEDGSLAGAWNRLGTVHNGKTHAVEMDSLGGRNLCGVHLHGRAGVAVGQGGLVLTTDAGGTSWSFAELGLAKGVPYDWDFHAVAGAAKQVWAVGRPGSAVLHSADDGAHWDVQQTGQPLPLDGAFFADEQHGWAVGELGSILATTDGGKNWKLQRRGGQRAAALFIHARPAGTPLDAVAQVGGQDGYLTAALRVTGPDPSGAALGRAADGFRFAGAVRQAGGAAAEMLWQFPVGSHLAHAGRDDLLPAWDQLHAGHAAEQMLRQFVLAVRMWRPDVIVADAPDSPGAEGVVAEVMKQAFQDAADPKIFPEQISTLGLRPWKPSKLYGPCNGKMDGPVALDLTAVSEPLESTLREFAENAASCLGDEAPVVPAQRAFRLIAANLSGAESQPHLMDGVELAQGGLARRPAVESELTPEAVKAIHRRAELRAIADAPIDGLTDPSKLLSQVGPMTADMPDDQAGRTIFAVAQRFARSGQWDLARETFLFLVQRYPAHPRTPDALRWLIQHNCSGEARRRTELGQFVVDAQLQYGLPKPTPPVMPPVEGDNEKPKKKAPNMPEFGVSESVRLGNIAGAETIRKWYQGALDMEPLLAAFGPVFADDPAVQFPLQAARRSIGQFDEADKWYADFVSRQPDGPWRSAAAAELWLARRVGAPPKSVAYCRSTEEKPFLDGKLDDACWQGVAPLPLRDAVGATAGDYKTEVRTAYDRDFLYVAVRCTHPAGRGEPLVKPRTHDADLSGHDRVSILIDVDRDYATYFHFEVDQRGCVADDCWGDKTWDPRWFVAVHKEDTEWVVEAAIPLAALTGDGLTPGRAWCCNVIRTVPGRGVQAWSLPAEAPEEAMRPEGMGLLIFTQDGKPVPERVGSAAP
ncbi:MAG TPA: YCF48-related protein [Gemmataceae bacterium]|nr:YCF48-related protein [Gemmataceae bacterium]